MRLLYAVVFFMNVLNSALMNTEPLSDMIISGRSYVAKNILSLFIVVYCLWLFMVAWDVAVVTT